VTRESGITLNRIAADGLVSVVDRMSGGVCVLDVDGRPPLDIFFAIRPGRDTRSELYIGHRAWEYVDETDMRGLRDVGDAVGCLAMDYDADGDDDLLVTGVGSIRLFENQEGRFVNRSAQLGFTPLANDMYTSAAAGDLDGDGDLDLVIGGFLRYEPGDRAGMRCGHFPCEAAIYSFPKLPSLMFLQQRPGVFQERSTLLAPELTAAEPSLCVAIGDVNTDGTPNIFIGNDLGATYYNRVFYREEAGNWIDIGDAVGLSLNRFAAGGDTMGFASGDLDNDGDFDHVMTSWEGDASAVYFCSPTRGCTDEARWAGTYALRRSLRWGAGLGDLDLDGDLDLVEATGHYHLGSELGELFFEGGWSQPLNVMTNRGDGHFETVALTEEDGTQIPRPTRGIALADLDDDGRIDIVVAPANGRPALLRNVVRTDGHYLRLQLIGHGGNRDAIGTVVRAFQAGLSQVRERRAGEGYLGNFDRRLHFGFPTGDSVQLEILWPRGTRERIIVTELDREITIRQSAPPGG